MGKLRNLFRFRKTYRRVCWYCESEFEIRWKEGDDLTIYEASYCPWCRSDNTVQGRN